MGTKIKARAHELLALAGAILLISASAALGAYYGFTLGGHTHVALGIVFAGAALGGEILKPIAVLTAIERLGAGRWLQGAVCAALAGVCIVYSLAAELSLAAGSRGDLAASRQLAVHETQTAEQRQARAEAELAALPIARPAAVLAPLIAKLKATPGANGCTAVPNGPISRRICGQVADLEAEGARAQRRVQLEAAIAAAAVAIGKAPSVRDADPLAAAVAAYAGALGIEVDPASLLPWLALITVLFLELGSAFALVVVRSTAAPTESPHAAEDASDAARTPDDMPELESRVIDLIRAEGGRLKSGQRNIAKTLGVSKSRLNELLHELAAAGRVHLDARPSGTTIQLASA